MIPEADEQIRGETDQLPAHEEQKHTIRDHHAEHGPGKERHEAEEAREVFVVGHVADGINEDQQADKADHHEHHGGERIEHPSEIDGGVAESEPCEVDRLPYDRAARPAGNDVSECNEREQQRTSKRSDGQ